MEVTEDNGGGPPAADGDGPKAASPWGDLTKVIAAGTAFAGLLTALAVAGIIGRLERNHGVLFVLACAFVLVAAGLWVAAAVKQATGRLEQTLQITGVAALLVGLVLGIVALALTQHEPNRPSITASLAGSKLTATIAASGLSVDDRIEVHVDGLTIAPNSQELRVTSYASLYWASLGADSDGNVMLPLTLQISSGTYDAVGIRAFTGSHSDCLESNQGTLRRQDGRGCVVMLLPPAPVVPLLSTSWRGKTLTATATADQAGSRELVLRIESYAGKRALGTLARGHGLPDATGHAALSASVVPPVRAAKVCVVAALLTGDERMPARACAGAPVRAAVAVLQIPR